MNSPSHLLRLEPAPTQRDSEAVRIVTQADTQWGLALFRAPSFPTAHQFNSELPFTVNLRPHSRHQT